MLFVEVDNIYISQIRRFHISPQHFPLYRQTEAICTGVDAPPPEEKQSTNREKWEVVSKEMSYRLLSLIRPRLVLSGHTHHGCYLVHKDGTPEMTIPSFSWRNRNNPSFVLVCGSSNICEVVFKTVQDLQGLYSWTPLIGTQLFEFPVILKSKPFRLDFPFS